MPRQKLLIALCLTAPLVLAACQSGSRSTTTAAAAPTPATTVATQGGGLKTIAEVAAGGVNWAGDEGPFALTISGGDGYQANPTNDASFATLINSVRTSVGAPPLRFDSRLNTAAQDHADDMLANDYFSHNGQNGSTIESRATAAGYNWTAIGENIAQGQRNENLAMNAWTSSPGHHRNNINPAFEDFGLGRSGTGSKVRWVLMLGAE